MALRQGVVDEVDREELDQGVLLPAGHGPIGSSQDVIGPGQQFLLLRARILDDLEHHLDGRILLALQRQALGLAEFSRSLLRLAGLFTAGQFDGGIVFRHGLVGLALREQHGSLGGGGADLQGRGAAVELLVCGERVCGFSGPRLEVSEQFLHLEEVVALRMLREIVGHRLGRRGEVTTGIEDGLRRGSNLDEIDLRQHQWFGTIEFVRFDLANFVPGIGTATAEEHRTGVLQRLRLRTELHLSNRFDRHFLRFAVAILHVNTGR